MGLWPAAYKPRFGQLSKQQAKLQAEGKHKKERIWIAFCEAAAALACLRRILPYVEPMSTLTFNEDNHNVVAWLAKLSCPSAMSQGIICEVEWLLAAFNVELDVRYITSKANWMADAASRWSSLTQPQRRKFLADYQAHQPSDWPSAGIVRRDASRPELFEVMDVWIPEDTAGEVGWFPPPLRR